MNNTLDQFWQDACALRLSDAERADARSMLRVRMLSDIPEGQLLGAAATLQLKSHEHAEGRRQLQNFMQSYQPEAQSWVSRFLNFSTSRLVFASTSAFVVVMLATGGVAEAALPGDMLYPVKIYVTEPIREQFAHSSDAQRTWELTRLERRFTERQRLIESGRFTEERREELEFLIDVQASRIEAHLDALPDTSDDPEIEDFRIHLTEVLTERQEAIDSIIQDRTVPEELVPIVQDARRRREQIDEQNIQRRERFDRIRVRLERRPAAGESDAAGDAPTQDVPVSADRREPELIDENSVSEDLQEPLQIEEKLGL